MPRQPFTSAAAKSTCAIGNRMRIFLPIRSSIALAPRTFSWGAVARLGVGPMPSNGETMTAMAHDTKGGGGGGTRVVQGQDQKNTHTSYPLSAWLWHEQENQVIRVEQGIMLSVRGFGVMMDGVNVMESDIHPNKVAFQRIYLPLRIDFRAVLSTNHLSHTASEVRHSHAPALSQPGGVPQVLLILMYLRNRSPNQSYRASAIISMVAQILASSLAP